VSSAAPSSNPRDLLVSVVVPCYNQARFLGECIESLLTQTHPRVEIVVVDDGSTDDSAEVAQSFGDRIVFLAQPNSGPASARTAGVLAAGGDVLAWCDGDDRLRPDCIERRLELLLGDESVGLVSGNVAFIDERGEKLDIPPEPHPGPVRVGFYGAVSRCWGATCGTVIRRSALEECGLMDPFLLTCEDWDLQIRIARKFAIVFDPRPLAEARQVSGSLSRIPLRLYDDGRRMLRKNRIYADSGWRYFWAGHRALFRQVVGMIFFRLRRERSGTNRLVAAIRLLLARPSLTVYVAAWLGRFVFNRIRRLLGIKPPP